MRRGNDGAPREVEMGEGSTGYRPTLRHPIAGRVFVGTAVSLVGDYVGQGALLLLAFDRSGGQVIGPAAIFAIQALPALFSGALAGSWLDQVSRTRALVFLHVVGAAALVLPLALPGLAPVLGAAAVLGAIRAANVSVRSAAIAEGVPEDLRGPLLGLIGTVEQSSQVVGYLSGAAIAVTVGAGPALIADAASFLVAAVVFLLLALPAPEARESRPPVTAGVREIFRNPVLRLVAPLVWVGVTVGAIPETFAASVTDDAESWTPFVLAAGPAGQALTMAVLGRVRHIERPSFQLTHLAWLALAFGIAALGQAPIWYLVGNFLVGSGVAWILGPQTLFVRVAPSERMAQITGTMIAAIIAFEGAGTLVFAFVADTWSVETAYRAAGFLVLALAIIGWFVKERTPEALRLDDLAEDAG